MSNESVSNKPLIRHVNRQQMSWRAVDVEQLISEDHPARAIWTLVGRLDLRRFYENIESSAEEGGRPAIDPHLLISLWVYAYSRGIGSAREIERRCEYDPAFQWLTGIEPVNYHTLADFRVEQGKELHQLFSDLLGVLSAERLITLEEPYTGESAMPVLGERGVVGNLSLESKSAEPAVRQMHTHLFYQASFT